MKLLLYKGLLYKKFQKSFVKKAGLICSKTLWRESVLKIWEVLIDIFFKDWVEDCNEVV